MELTLQQLFGANAYQDDQILRIQKSDFPFSNNFPTAQAWFIGLVEIARKNFNGYLTGNNEFITSENLNFLDYDNSSAYENIAVLYKRSDLVEINGLIYKVHKFEFKIFELI